MKAHIPTKVTSKKWHQPWLTADIRRKTRRKHRLYKKARRTGSTADWDAFKSAKKITSASVKRARINHINTRVIGGLEEGNTKPFWRYIKSLKQENVSLPPLRQGGKLFSASLDKANILLKEFSSVFTREDTSFIPWLGRAPHQIDPIYVQAPGVRKLLAELKPGKASGPDRIPNRVLKELADELAPPLTALFNQSLDTGALPSDWNKAFISPVFKKGNVHEAANYRPVSLTCVACKLLEHIVCKHMLNYLDKHKLLFPLQHGFRKGHSCESQILITMDDLFRAFDRRIQTDIGISPSNQF